GSSWVPPLITARYFSSCPSDSISRWTPCPPKYYKQWLQVRLGCIQLSPLCPFGRLHTFCFLRPARFYPRFRIWRSSFERQRDFNPPEQHAAQLALLSRETLSFSASCRFIPANCNGDVTPIKIDDLLILKQTGSRDPHLDFAARSAGFRTESENDPTIHCPRAYGSTCLVL